MAHGQDDRERCRDDERLAILARSLESEDPLGRNLLNFVEPPSADPHARWCGEGARQRASLPDFVFSFGLRNLKYASADHRGHILSIDFKDQIDRLQSHPSGS